MDETWNKGCMDADSDAGMGSYPGISLLREQNRLQIRAHSLFSIKHSVLKRMLQTYMKMHMKAHRPQDMDEGPFLVQVVTSQ